MKWSSGAGKFVRRCCGADGPDVARRGLRERREHGDGRDEQAGRDLRLGDADDHCGHRDHHHRRRQRIGFAKIPRQAIARLQKRYFFYVWNEQQSVVRWMCSFDTTEEDVTQFAKFVAETVRT